MRFREILRDIQAVWISLNVVEMCADRGQDKMAVILQTTFSNSFPCMEMTVFLFKFHWNFPVAVNYRQALVQIMASRRTVAPFTNMV